MYTIRLLVPLQEVHLQWYNICAQIDQLLVELFDSRQDVAHKDIRSIHEELIQSICTANHLVVSRIQCRNKHQNKCLRPERKQNETEVPELGFKMAS